MENMIQNIPEDLTLLVRKAVMHKKTMDGHKKAYESVKLEIDAKLTEYGLSGRDIYKTNAGETVSLGNPWEQTIDKTILADLLERSESVRDILTTRAMTKLLDITVGFAEDHGELKESIVKKDIIPPMRFKFPKEPKE